MLTPEASYGEPERGRRHPLRQQQGWRRPRSVVIERNAAATPSSYCTVNQGFDSGWKDTALIWPGERVKIAMTFGPHMGMYMYHCHILEHEDMTMMRNYMIMDPMMPS